MLFRSAFQAELLRIKEYISRRHGHVSFQLNSRQVKGKATVFFRIEAPLVPDGRIYLSGDIGALGNMESGNPGLVLHQADRSGDRGVYTNRLVLERACFFKIRLRARPEGWHAAEQQSMSDGKKSRIVCALPGKSEYRASVRRWGGN